MGCAGQHKKTGLIGSSGPRKEPARNEEKCRGSSPPLRVQIWNSGGKRKAGADSRRRSRQPDARVSALLPQEKFTYPVFGCLIGTPAPEIPPSDSHAYFICSHEKCSSSKMVSHYRPHKYVVVFLKTRGCTCVIHFYEQASDKGSQQRGSTY